jgi:hypothetical protein
MYYLSRFVENSYLTMRLPGIFMNTLEQRISAVNNHQFLVPWKFGTNVANTKAEPIALESYTRSLGQ